MVHRAAATADAVPGRAPGPHAAPDRRTDCAASHLADHQALLRSATHSRERGCRPASDPMRRYAIGFPMAVVDVPGIPLPDAMALLCARYRLDRDRQERATTWSCRTRFRPAARRTRRARFADQGFG